MNISCNASSSRLFIEPLSPELNPTPHLESHTVSEDYTCFPRLVSVNKWNDYSITGSGMHALDLLTNESYTSTNMLP